MQPITFDPSCYRIDGRPVYLHSGEFHYFRVPKADWRRRMRLFRKAGGNCLATYIPWLIHEPSEGTFAFGGQDWLDVEGFMQAAYEEGLYVIARPGPYQYSELLYDGLPGWLCEGYPDLRAQDVKGRPFRTSSVSYLHPLFLEKVRRWFAQVCPILARHTVSRGGPIAFVQLDNEMTGIHRWFGSLDYNAVTMGFGRYEGRYPTFLRRRYGDVSALNHAYGTAYSCFEEVMPQAPCPEPTPGESRRARDYVEFYLGTIAEYAQFLAELIREAGIDAPLVHNSANPRENALFLETVRALGSSFLLGSDHYYNLGSDWHQNNPTPQYAVDVFCSLEMLRLFGVPPTVFELPGGSCSDWPPVTPGDARACYLANIALGMKGSNYYIFTGGPNPPGTGATTDVYDYGAAIGARGEVRPLYQVQKELGHFLAARPWLMEAEREADCRLALDWDQARAGEYPHAGGDSPFPGDEAWGFLRSGVLPSAFCASLSPAFVDLDADSWLADQATPLVVVSGASMATARQERIVRFLQGGGRALIAPVLPSLNESLQPCTLLAGYLGRPTVEPSRSQVARVTIEGVANILKNGALFLTTGLPAGAEVLGRDELSGQPVAWQTATAGGGQAIFLGFSWRHAMREHERMLLALLARLGLQQKVACSNPNVWTSLRTAGGRSMLFIMNLLTAPMEAEIRCRPGWSRGWIRTGRHSLAAMEVKAVELGAGR